MNPASSPDLSAIVVAHDSGAELQACIASVRREAERAGIAHEILVVDNASVDAAVDALTDEGDLRVIKNPRNLGFGAAVNQGFQVSSGERILLLNPDAELCEGSLEPLLAALDTEGAALAAPSLILPDGSRQESPRRFYGPLVPLARRTFFGRSRLGRRLAAGHLLEENAGQQATSVDWVTGAAMVLERSAVPIRGPFDERYFLYFEDVDLCRRLRAQGHKVIFEPRARVRHRFGGGSRHQVPWNPLLWHHLRSAALYTLRWSRGWWTSRWWRHPTRLLLDRATSAAVLAAMAWLTLGPGLGLLAGLLGACVLPHPARRQLGRAPLPGLVGSGLRLAAAGVVLLALSSASLAPAQLVQLATWVVAGSCALDVLARLRRAAARSLRRRGIGHTTCILAGDPEAASRLASALLEQPEEGLEVLGFTPLDPLAEGGPSPRLPDWSRIVESAQDLRADSVVVTGSADDLARMAREVARLRHRGVEVAFAHVGSTELLQARDPAQLAGHPLLPLGSGSPARTLDWLALGLGRFCALAGLVVLLPVAPILLLLSWFASRQSPLVRSVRVGQNLAPFAMLRLRSGPGKHCDSGGGRLGQLMRTLHLDELPQLWNVVCGEMSLVGPRPVEPEVLERLRPWEHARFIARPGITGMWQLDRLRRWRLEQMIASDLLYILRWSPTLDGRILTETLLGRRNP